MSKSVGKEAGRAPVVLEALEAEDVQHTDRSLHLLPIAPDVRVDRRHEPVEQLPVECLGESISCVVRLPRPPPRRPLPNDDNNKTKKNETVTKYSAR